MEGSAVERTGNGVDTKGKKPARDQPDIMNDPAYDTNNSAGQNGRLKDNDTCRICRSEPTETEPLYYPCKCSGSIKFVHQECLMEWLSHSQKKYCELCKTPFRFTKLYDPHMPTTLPAPLFVKYFLSHTLSAFITWLRLFVVCFVWLAGLPWCMRSVWRFFFWMADGGWVSWEKIADAGTNGTVARITSVASKTAASLSGAATSTGGLPRVIHVLMPNRHSANASASSVTPTLSKASQRQSFLSQVSFFNTLTRSSTVNKILIDTIEGQIITLLVVVAFILVFLIREWVVQQHPGLHAGAGQNDEALGLRPEPPQAPPNPQPNAREAQRHRAHRPADIPRIRIDNDLADGRGDRREAPDRARAIALPRRRMPPRPQPQNNDNNTIQFDSTRFQRVQQRQDVPSPDSSQQPPDRGVFRFNAQPIAESSANTQRPSLPSRQSLSRANEIRRSIEEEKRSEKYHWPGLEIFMDFWSRAEGNPERVLTLIEAEGRTEELGWIVAAMKRLQDGESHNAQTHLQITVPSVPSPSASQAEIQSGNFRVPTQLNFPSVQNDTPDEAQHSPSSDLVYKVWADRTNETTTQASPISEGSASTSPTKRFRLPPITPIPPLNTDQTRKGKERDESTAAAAEPSQQLLSDDFLFEMEADSPVSTSPAPTDVPTTRNLAVGPVNTASSSDTEPQDTPTLSTASDTSLAGPSQNPDPAVADETGSLASDGEPSGDAHVSDEELDDHAMEAHPLADSVLERIADWVWDDPRYDDDAGRIAAEDNRPPGEAADNGQAIPPAAENRPPRAARANDINPEAQPAPGDIPPPDADAIEDGEDLEGVMELIGMRGPLFGLIQNALFSAVIISATIGIGVWVPYIWGKLVIFVAANPVQVLVGLPLRWLTTISDVVVDLSLFFGGSVYYQTDWVVRYFIRTILAKTDTPATFSSGQFFAQKSLEIAQQALERLSIITNNMHFDFSGHDLPIFSIVSHEGLQLLKSKVSAIGSLVSVCVSHTYSAVSEPDNWNTWNVLSVLFWPLLSKDQMIACGSYLRHVLLSITSAAEYLKQAAQAKQLSSTLILNPDMAYWNAGDRTLAIIAGYAFFCGLGAFYLRKIIPYSSSANGRRLEGIIADILRQAGGVIKVILIIGIEMIIFPLYCGMLLDLALLPLFDGAGFNSRLQFSLSSVWTSVFVHWFVGTCYMFHFALFVSMCRKIMRNGVLYFIRDPDDPTFHPVRDVLERSVATQLRKITFSALVYGALVIVCLGGVVWGLFYAVDSILPIQWSSNEPVLEFPVDLLFYNFFMPLAVKFLKPADGLHTMYAWWFRKCAKSLRLTWFLFGERQILEEGYLPKTWTELFQAYGLAWIPGEVKPTDIEESDPTSDAELEEEENDEEQSSSSVSNLSVTESNSSNGSQGDEPDLDSTIYPSGFIRDGRYVRAPGADQVRIPRGGPVFREINADAARTHGASKKDSLFTTVYIPPHFKFRIALFVIAIWLFAAVTGVSLTILPLLIGRHIFVNIIPAPQRMNDLYAFSFGVCILGAVSYGAKEVYTKVRKYATNSTALAENFDLANFLSSGFDLLKKTMKIIYLGVVLLLILPSILALIMETYLLIPLHTYIAPQETHVIHLAQDWTLGVLYLILIIRLIKKQVVGRRPAAALRLTIRNGILDADVRVATKAFVLPSLVAAAIVLTAPLMTAKFVMFMLYGQEVSEHFAETIYQFSYPAVAAAVGWVFFAFRIAEAAQRWSSRVRDEVYLVGERLHNFGESKRVPRTVERL